MKKRIYVGFGWFIVIPLLIIGMWYRTFFRRIFALYPFHDRTVLIFALLVIVFNIVFDAWILHISLPLQTLILELSKDYVKVMVPYREPYYVYYEEYKYIYYAFFHKYYMIFSKVPLTAKQIIEEPYKIHCSADTLRITYKKKTIETWKQCVSEEMCGHIDALEEQIEKDIIEMDELRAKIIAEERMKRKNRWHRRSK